MCAVTRSKTRNRQRGLTLLEVLISISLICTFMVSFAAVFPASFRLTRKTSTANQAAAYAAAVAEELRSKMIGKPMNELYSGSLGKYLEDYVGDSRNMASRIPLSASDMQSKRLTPSIALPAPYTLINPNKPASTGILVYTGEQGGRTFWTISVTMYWTETSPNGDLQKRSTTICTAKTANIITL